MYGAYRHEIGGWFDTKPSWSKWKMFHPEDKEDAIYHILQHGVRSPAKYEVGLTNNFDALPKTPKAKFPGAIYITENEIKKFQTLYYAIEDDAGEYKKNINSLVKELAQKFGRISNPSSSFTAEEAQELAREFHGRENRDTTEFVVNVKMPRDVAQIGLLIELQVWVGDAPEVGEKVKDGEYIPINFAGEYPKANDPTVVYVGGVQKAGEDTGQLYFIGGDQEFDVAEFSEAADLGYDARELKADSILLGPVKAIAYFADKHHLEGPREQKKGIPYQHEFAIDESTGEVVGEWPDLYYWPKEKQFKLVGGSYQILPEGISG